MKVLEARVRCLTSASHAVHDMPCTTCRAQHAVHGIRYTCPVSHPEVQGRPVVYRWSVRCDEEGCCTVVPVVSELEPNRCRTGLEGATMRPYDDDC